MKLADLNKASTGKGQTITPDELKGAFDIVGLASMPTPNGIVRKVTCLQQQGAKNPPVQYTVLVRDNKFWQKIASAYKAAKGGDAKAKPTIDGVKFSEDHYGFTTLE